MAKNHCKIPERKDEKALEPDTAHYSLVVEKDSPAEEVSKNVANNSVNNVLREICENNKKAEIKYIEEAETSSQLDYEHKVETKDPS